jgi:hypothetical protein
MHFPTVSATRRLYFIVLSMVLGSTACSLHEPPRVVPITDPPAFRPRGPQQVKTLPEALAAIITVCTEDLGLPAVVPLNINLYSDTDSYSFYTNRISKMPENKPRLTFALPYENQLHVNLETVRGQSWGALLRMLAHEYGHNVEYELSAGATVPRWISEGFAEWVAAKVMDRLGWESYSSSLGRARRELVRLDGSAALPNLETVSGWAETSAKPSGRVATYDLSFIAIDKLIEAKGLPAVMDYFASKDFAGEFGRSREEFARSIAADLDGAQNAARDIAMNLSAAMPQWKIGYQWRYAISAPGLKPALIVNEIVRDEIFDGRPVYVLATGNNEYPHEKETLRVLATISRGKTISKNDPPSLPLDWPLKVGLRWQNNYVLKDIEGKPHEKIETEVVVGDAETVRVPAGSFPALRVETYASPGGELISDQWYAPAVKWFVKSKFYREDGVVEQNLVSFKAD